MVVLLNLGVPAFNQPCVVQSTSGAQGVATLGKLKSAMCPDTAGDANINHNQIESNTQEGLAASAPTPGTGAPPATLGGEGAGTRAASSRRPLPSLTCRSTPQPADARQRSVGMDTSFAPETASPKDVAQLHAAAAADSQQSTSNPPTSPPDPASCADSSSSGAPRGTAGALSPSPSRTPSLSPSEAGELHQLAAEAAAATAASTHLRRSTSIDLPALVARLKQRPLTGQVVAWGWDAAAVMSRSRRTLPAQVLSSLWPATQACALKPMMPQDLLEILESWLTLMQQCPRHFRLSRGVLEALATYALPAAVKRMSERQLAQLAGLARDIALHRGDAEMQVSNPRQAGGNARDLMQPVLALAAAEVAWRVSNPSRYVSPETVSAVVTAATAWSWRVVRHRDSQPLAALKLATAAALEELLPHSPRDLAQSGAFRKLKMGPSGSNSARGISRGGSGGSSAGAGSGGLSGRTLTV